MENYSLNELIEKYKLSKEEHNKVLELLKKIYLQIRLLLKIHRLCLSLDNQVVGKQHFNLKGYEKNFIP